MIKKLYGRGLNFHGQLGLGPNIQYVQDKFIKIPTFDLNISKIYTNLGHSLALLDGIENINQR